jgi:YhcN/YlaJ family sporulation lipoprotein
LENIPGKDEWQMRKWITVLIVIGCLVAGCGSNGNQQETRMETHETQPNQRLEIKSEDSQQIAERLIKLATSVPQVNSATCVVLGKTAIVGIDVDADLDRSRVGTIKYSVAEALRKDPAGINAVVTADVDLNARIREIADEIRAGRPVSAFANELADIIGRIMPQLPKDTKPRGTEDPTKNEDRRKLEQQQM